uniref:hypothetical protein n=1 Tax=Burkholderia anthina TaxID=179879 RepID=UPI00158AD260|nr:hypothetical protein [Burkholderia anthina]
MDSTDREKAIRTLIEMGKVYREGLSEVTALITRELEPLGEKLKEEGPSLEERDVIKERVRILEQLTDIISNVHKKLDQIDP